MKSQQHYDSHAREDHADNIAPIVLPSSRPIEQFLDKIFLEATALFASDIHFEVFSQKFVIRYRVNGELITLDDCEQELAGPVFSRLKILSNLNISETRLPQDGSIEYRLSDRVLEFRVSCLPTQFGESIVLRVLNNWNYNFCLDNLFARHDNVKMFLKNITDCSGLILFVGPTGCGKSTTLYSVLREINKEELKILSCEDPVEQRIPGISQSNINGAIGFSFARALRAFLRHDPDVIFVGEIRDKETADLAIRAAITGHCVVSTLHANDAASAVPRMLDLGVDKVLLAESLICVIYQQLEVMTPTASADTANHTRRENDNSIVDNDRKRYTSSSAIAHRRAKFDVLFFDKTIKAAIKCSA